MLFSYRWWHNWLLGLVWSYPHPILPARPSSSLHFFSRSYEVHCTKVSYQPQQTSLVLAFPWLTLYPAVASLIGLFVIIQSISNLLAGQHPQFIHWPCEYSSILHDLYVCKQFSESHIWISPFQHGLHSLAGWNRPFCLEGILWVLLPGWVEVPGQYLGGDGLGLIKPMPFNPPRDAVAGNSWVIMKCKWDRSHSFIRSCEFPGFGTSSASCWFTRSLRALGLAWESLPYRDRFLDMSFGILCAEGVKQMLNSFPLRDHLCRGKSEGNAGK